METEQPEKEGEREAGSEGRGEAYGCHKVMASPQAARAQPESISRTCRK